MATLSATRQDSERKRKQLELQLQDMSAKLSDVEKSRTDNMERAQKLQVRNGLHGSVVVLVIISFYLVIMCCLI